MFQIIGHNPAVTLLQRSQQRGVLVQAYLFAGPPHIGKMALAINLAGMVNCESPEPPCGQCESCRKIASGTHADVEIIRRENDAAEISIDRVRQMQASASLPPFAGKCKVFIIDGAEYLSLEAANCLLKTLEEPVGRVIFVLLTAGIDLLPATVVSRCLRLELALVPSAEIEKTLVERGIEPKKAGLLARLSHGCPGWAIRASSDPALLQQRAERLDELLTLVNADYEVRFVAAAGLADRYSQDRGTVSEILELWQDWWRDLLLIKSGCGDRISNGDYEKILVEQAGRYRLDQVKSVINAVTATEQRLRLNANPRLVFEVLMLTIPGKEECGAKKLATKVLVNG